MVPEHDCESVACSVSSVGVCFGFIVTSLCTLREGIHYLASQGTIVGSHARIVDTFLDWTSFLIVRLRDLDLGHRAGPLQKEGHS